MHATVIYKTWHTMRACLLKSPPTHSVHSLRQEGTSRDCVRLSGALSCCCFFMEYAPSVPREVVACPTKEVEHLITKATPSGPEGAIPPKKPQRRQ